MYVLKNVKSVKIRPSNAYTAIYKRPRGYRANIRGQYFRDFHAVLAEKLRPTRLTKYHVFNVIILATRHRHIKYKYPFATHIYMLTRYHEYSCIIIDKRTRQKRTYTSLWAKRLLACIGMVYGCYSYIKHNIIFYKIYRIVSIPRMWLAVGSAVI